MRKSIYPYFLIAFLFGLTSCLQDNEFYPSQQEQSNYLTLTLQSDRLLPQQVATRAADPKGDLEKKINYLHIFFFGADGNYLDNYEQNGKVRFIAYQETSESMVKVDKAAVKEVDNNGVVQVYALANMNGYGLFDEKDQYNRPILEGGSSHLDALKKKVLEYSNLEATKLQIPASGMPMLGNVSIDFNDDNLEKGITLGLSALMARVDFSIKLDAKLTNGNLPMLYLQSYTVGNVPNKVQLLPDVNTTDMTTMGANTVTINNHALIYNKNGEISFTFYMFENLQGKVNGYSYPGGTTASDYPRYKPLLAGDRPAAYVDLNTVYTTYDGIDNVIIYRLYLGSNHTNCFDVKRNHQYKNDITIKGITKNTEVGQNYFTYDARVTVENSEYYVSVLNEKALDAHFNVLPMDVYFLGDNAIGRKLEVCLGEKKVTINDKEYGDTEYCYYDNNNNVSTFAAEPWIRMEKIPAIHMTNGSLPEGTSDTHVNVTGSYQPNNGIRKFFTENLVTNTLKESGKSIIANASRDRIYFYIDENLGDNERIGTITLKYYEKINPESDTYELKATDYFQIKQLPLLKVAISSDGKAEGYTDGAKNPYTTIWMEQIEEYLESYDPLDTYTSNNMFEGLPWGFKGSNMLSFSSLYGNKIVVNGTNYTISDFDSNYYMGYVYTTILMQISNLGNNSTDDLTLKNKPANAAQYCYHRNKRLSDGKVENTTAASIHDGLFSDYYELIYGNITSKWFLPGIRQMEVALKGYYNKFSEFQGNFYWSSASGKSGDAKNNARATKIDENGVYVESSGTNPGAKSRDDASVRIRAFRIDRKKR